MVVMRERVSFNSRAARFTTYILLHLPFDKMYSFVFDAVVGRNTDYHYHFHTLSNTFDSVELIDHYIHY